MNYLKKNRRFELKYDIYKGLAWSLPQIHWIITQFDWAKLTKAFENIWYWRVLVSNFFGEKVKEKLEIFRKEATEIQKRRDEIYIELNKISGERIKIEEIKKKYLNIISSSQPKNLKEVVDRVSIETEIQITDKEIFESQIKIIFELMNEIKAALSRVYPLCEGLLIEMANELKEEYLIEKQSESLIKNT